MVSPAWHIDAGDSPLVAVALHSGHDLREEVGEWLEIPRPDRYREEDPCTARWTDVAPTRVVVSRSRFEVDLNRPRERAVYGKAENAWGLNLWKETLPTEMVERSLEIYDAFYSNIRGVLEELESRFGHFFVYEFHAYNHRRGGAEALPDPPQASPEINIGTGTMVRDRWAALIDRLIDDLRAFDFLGRHLDVRENVRFRGGHFSRWVNESFPETGCALPIEIKKFFMDEWTGDVFPEVMKAVGEGLRSTVPGVLEELGKLSSGLHLAR